MTCAVQADLTPTNPSHTMNTAKFPLGLNNTAIQHWHHGTTWIWEGVIALHTITLLSAPEKTGKTTLLGLLLDRRRAGGSLMGRPVAPGSTIVCTEESPHLWHLRQPPLDFGPNVIFRHPRGGGPDGEEWEQFIEELSDHSIEMEDTETGPPNLLVIDTAVSFLPLQHRNKHALRRVLRTLTGLADLGMGVLIINQSRTVERPLAAFADIVIRMSIPRADTETGRTRRRTFVGVGRDPRTLELVHAELNPEGTDYQVLKGPPPPTPPILTTIQTLLAESPTPLTHHELLARWPGAAPHPDSLCRTLKAGVERGVLTATGAGTKAEPQRYGLANK
jgi:hypothetical protein